MIVWSRTATRARQKARARALVRPPSFFCGLGKRTFCIRSVGGKFGPCAFW
ncbi:MAG: hypothetical protein HOB37_02390 [Rhodospirillaceae bacterium]|nr:hypothetical protein [Rhodospirillaceae bacterium]MBT3910019.1 hypothetical protein [Rhodospirillaceae bacterium]MBT5297176.1 hypothetical protein [Rhodospirillaceae bacterium]MBT5514351.1 hypothetical protein [Rhodospirillaceae bacterium]MBT6087039.1 hypothetical protein [Rhodospirillaceae bacterium]